MKVKMKVSAGIGVHFAGTEIRPKRIITVHQTVRCLVVLHVALFLTRCATLQAVPAESLHDQRLAQEAMPVAHIYAANWGIYLLKFIPLLTGNLDEPGIPRWPRLFTDNVRVDLLVSKVTAESQRRGATTVTDLRTRDLSYWMSFTLVLWLNEFEVSGNASRPVVETPGP